MPKDSTIWGEGLLLLYAIFLIGWSLAHGMWWLIGWLLLYAAGYTVMIVLALKQSHHGGGKTAVSLEVTGPVNSGD